MPGIPFIDNNTSYAFAKFLSVFIQVGMPIFSVFSVGILFADWKSWQPRHFWSRCAKWTAHIIIFGIAIFCILYGVDGRYTETEVGDHGQTDYYYFGGEKNDVRFGFGKLFDDEKNIYMISEAKGNKTYDHVKKYSIQNGEPLISFEGSIVNGMREGEGRQYTFIDGERYLKYDGSFHKDKYEGIGSEYQYYEENAGIQQKYIGEFIGGKACGHGKLWKYDENGSLTYYSEGGWADDKHCGYGIGLTFEDGIVCHAYRGTYWYGELWGEGIEEYNNDSDEHVIWVGYYSEGEQGEDGAYYHENGEFWPTESNGTIIEDSNGGSSRDEERIAELKEKWPFPDELILGKSAEDVIEVLK